VEVTLGAVEVTPGAEVAAAFMVAVAAAFMAVVVADSMAVR
jgi:hypothetical protein